MAQPKPWSDAMLLQVECSEFRQVTEHRTHAESLSKCPPYVSKKEQTKDKDLVSAFKKLMLITFSGTKLNFRAKSKSKPQPFSLLSFQVTRSAAKQT